MKKALIAALTLCACGTAFASSLITNRLDDPKAVYVNAPATAGDSSAALQEAIDKASGTGREGIVFIAEGRYAITRTLYLWPGVRLIGYGAARPVFVLPPNTPGFQKGMGVMVMFTGLAPHEQAARWRSVRVSTPGIGAAERQLADANPNTFYSAMSNIDFEIGDGNPAAVAVRFHVAQHSFLSHMDFHLGSGLAGALPGWQ